MLLKHNSAFFTHTSMSTSTDRILEKVPVTNDVSVGLDWLRLPNRTLDNI